MARDRNALAAWLANQNRRRRRDDFYRNAELASLALSDGTLEPPFAPDVTDYTATVANATDSVTVTAEPAVPESTVELTLGGASASNPIALAEGENVIAATVTSGGGSTTQVYTVTVTREAPEV